MGTTTIETLQVQLKADVDDLKKQMDAARKSLGQLESESKETREELKKLSSEGVKLQNSFGGLKSLFAGLGTAYVGKKLIDIGKSSIQMAMDVVESESLFETSMGNMAEEARKWSDQLSESLGLNAYELRQNVGVMYNMTKSMGIASDTAYDLSTSLVMLAQDMVSFYNMDTEEAFTKLRAGITGETEPLKALGILVDENTIKQYAYKNGLAATGEELTQQQKVLARYYAILDQTSTAQGDLARTIESPANQLRILKAQLEQAKLELGMGLLPVVQEVMPYMVAFAQKLTEIIGALFGVEKASQSLSNSLGGADYSSITQAAKSEVALGDAIEDTDKKLKKSLTGFDEINKLGTGAESLADQMGLSDADLSFNIPTLGNNLELGNIFDNDKLKDAREAIDNICEVIGNLRGVLLALVGYKVIKGFGAIKEGISGLTGTTGKMTKKLIGAGGAVVAFDSTRTAAREFASENTNLAAAISSLVTGGAGAIAAGLSFGGPLGIAIAAFSVLGGALTGVIDASEEQQKKMADKIFYQERAVGINDLQNALRDLHGETDTYISKQDSLRRELENNEQSFTDCYKEADRLWSTLKESPELDESEINDMRTAIDNLFDSCDNFRNTSFDIVFSGFDRAIENTFGVAAQNKIKDLSTELGILQRQLNIKSNKLEQEAEEIFARTEANGGIMSESDRQRMGQIIEESSRLAPAKIDAATEVLKNKLSNLKGEISFVDEQTAINSLSGMQEQLKTSISGLQEAFITQKNLLDWAKDNNYLSEEKYSESIDILKGSRDAEIKNIVSSYNQVYEAIQEQYDRNISTIAGERAKYYGTWKGGVAWVKDAFTYGGISDAIDTSPTAKLINEIATDWAQDQQKEVRDSLAALQKELEAIVLPTGLRLNQYATGGFPEDGLFYANHEELIGKFTNGKTAVANNLQILEGIKQAVLEALQTAGGMDGGNWTIQVVDTDGNIKAEQIISAAERRNRRDGRTILPLGD